MCAVRVYRAEEGHNFEFESGPIRTYLVINNEETKTYSRFTCTLKGIGEEFPKWEELSSRFSEVVKGLHGCVLFKRQAYGGSFDDAMYKRVLKKIRWMIARNGQALFLGKDSIPIKLTTCIDGEKPITGEWETIDFIKSQEEGNDTL